LGGLARAALAFFGGAHARARAQWQPQAGARGGNAPTAGSRPWATRGPWASWPTPNRHQTRRGAATPRPAHCRRRGSRGRRESRGRRARRARAARRRPWADLRLYVVLFPISALSRTRARARAETPARPAPVRAWRSPSSFYTPRFTPSARPPAGWLAAAALVAGLGLLAASAASAADLHGPPHCRVVAHRARQGHGRQLGRRRLGHAHKEVVDFLALHAAARVVRSLVRCCDS